MGVWRWVRLRWVRFRLVENSEQRQWSSARACGRRLEGGGGWWYVPPPRLDAGGGGVVVRPPPPLGTGGGGGGGSDPPEALASDARLRRTITLGGVLITRILLLRVLL